jgi:hypothetical protein
MSCRYRAIVVGIVSMLPSLRGRAFRSPLSPMEHWQEVLKSVGIAEM